MKIVFIFKFLLLMIGFVPALKSALGQEPIIISDSIFSKVLNEERKIKICLPVEYKPGVDAKYDVVYIIDGEMHFNDFIYIYRFAGNENFLPPLILIGLPNTYKGEVNMRRPGFFT